MSGIIKERFMEKLEVINLDEEEVLSSEKIAEINNRLSDVLDLIVISEVQEEELPDLPDITNVGLWR